MPLVTRSMAAPGSKGLDCGFEGEMGEEAEGMVTCPRMRVPSLSRKIAGWPPELM